MKQFLIIAFTLLSNNIFSQAPSIQWQKTFGGSSNDVAKSIIGLPNGKILVAGYSSSNIVSLTCPSPLNYWIFQLDSSLNQDWMKCYGGSGADLAQCIKRCPDGGYIVVGSTNSKDGDVVGLHNPIFNPFDDIWVLKLDSLGNIEWQKCLGGSAVDVGYDISITNDGGYILTGEVWSMDGDILGNHGDDIWICKLNSIGTIEWSKCLGGYDTEQPSSCIQTFDGGYLVAGSTLSMDSIVTDNHGISGYPDAWVVSLDNLGNVKWTKCYGGTGIDNGKKIIPTWDGGFYLICQTTSQDGDVGSHNGSLSIWVIRADSLGAIIWKKTYGGTIDEVGTATRTSDGGIAIVGTTRGIPGLITNTYGIGEISIIKLGSLGNTEWGNAFGGSSSEIGYSIYETTNQSFVLAGVTRSDDFDVTNNYGFDDAWVVKLSPPNVAIDEVFRPINYFNAICNNGILNINFNSKISSDSEIELIDVTGKILLKKRLYAIQGNNSLQLDLDNIRTGLLIVRLKIDSYILNEKVFIPQD